MTSCTGHHWLLSGSSREAMGTCKHCGKQRLFSPNAPEDYYGTSSYGKSTKPPRLEELIRRTSRTKARRQ